MKPILAVYPGTFDPITYGHIDVVERAAQLFSKLVILVARNTSKAPLFTDDERVAMIRELFRRRPSVEVDAFDGLLVDYARRRKASVIVRGLRAVSDFEVEFQMALTNRKLARELETIFLVPREQYSYLNSTIVREIARLGGDVSDFVPPIVRRKLRAKFKAGR
ncbi:MAG: pantetheine-phosphate adenylyltransferase [Bacteroidetes bacterium]|nr:pantetheine-phosphate adenylyltransferase [Bacteroidota bacterium]